MELDDNQRDRAITCITAVRFGLQLLRRDSSLSPSQSRVLSSTELAANDLGALLVTCVESSNALSEKSVDSTLATNPASAGPGETQIPRPTVPRRMIRPRLRRIPLQVFRRGAQLLLRVTRAVCSPFSPGSLSRRQYRPRQPSLLSRAS